MEQNTNNTLSLNVASFRKDVRMVGPGVRDAIWLQGCSLNCPGCANQSYLSQERRVLISVPRMLNHFSLRVGKISGCTVSGGEPTDQSPAVTALFYGVKSLGLTTVLYSGRTWESLQADSGCRKLLAHTDLLIDGPFIQEQQDLSLQWRGSRNQRLIRLSDCIPLDEVDDSSPNGELNISPGQLRLTGIGTRKLHM